jgi:hypothetical protein
MLAASIFELSKYVYSPAGGWRKSEAVSQTHHRSGDIRGVPRIT